VFFRCFVRLRLFVILSRSSFGPLQCMFMLVGCFLGLFVGVVFSVVLSRVSMYFCFVLHCFVFLFHVDVFS
jgi:hypothetical protein